MLRVLSSAAAALGILSTAAYAADLPLPDEPIPAAVVTTYDWTGFYIGASGGWGFNDGGVDYDCANLGPVCFTAGGPFPTGANLDVDGAIIGGTVGANWQFNSIVLGVEGDASWTDWNDSETVVFQPGDTASSAFDFDWFATARARVGFAADRFLIFATGGAAFANVELTTTALGIPENFVGSSDEVEVGWTAGGGVEIGVTPHLSFKAEGLYYDLGDLSVTATDPVNFPGFSYDAEAELTGVIARGGINWRF